MMGKKILVITGSPRKGGNTFAMTDSFIKAAEARGHSITRIDAAFSNVAGCRGCEECYSKGEPCVFDDDFNKMASDMLAADAIVFTAPVYWYSFPAQIKAVMDRMFCFAVGGKKEIRGKECALITCCEESDMGVMDGLIKPFERAAALMEWKVVGAVRVPSVFKIGDISKTDGCAQAAALAEKF